MFKIAQCNDQVTQLLAAGLYPDVPIAFGASAEQASRPRHLNAARDALMSQVPTGSAVLLDSTTLRSAVIASDATDLDPIMLLDLSVVAFAFVAFDNVIIQPHRLLPCNDADPCFGGALKTLSMSRDLIMGDLWSFLAPLINMNYERAGFTDAWRTFLGREDITIDGRVIDRAQDSPQYWDGVPASFYLSTYIPSPSCMPHHESDSLNEFLSVQTIRALYNDNIAGLLRIPYLSSSIRSPIYSELLRRKLETQLTADKLLASLGPSPIAAPSNSPYVVEASAPFLLGIILSRMKSPADFWTALHELRQEFAPLRRRLHDDSDSWRGRSGVYLANYLRHLKNYLPDDAKLAENTLEATATAVASVTTSSVLGGAAAKLLIKLITLLNPTKEAYDWYLRTFKPDVAIVVELSKEASKLRSVETEIERIWKDRWHRQHREQLEWLAASRPEAFAKLRTLA
jgi:hypothetical protein